MALRVLLGPISLAIAVEYFGVNRGEFDETCELFFISHLSKTQFVEVGNFNESLSSFFDTVTLP